MQVKTIIHEKYTETEIHVCNHETNEKLKKLTEEIAAFVNPGLPVQRQNGDKMVLQEKDVISFFAQGQKVFARTAEETYVTTKKLYALEQDLNDALFFRISKSEIINLKYIQKLDMSLSGTIKVIMKDGSETYTSRRNVARLKKTLGI